MVVPLLGDEIISRCPPIIDTLFFILFIPNPWFLLIGRDSKSMPVSYTHLDVYKRQPLFIAMILKFESVSKFFKFKFLSNNKEPINTLPGKATVLSFLLF